MDNLEGDEGMVSSVHLPSLPGRASLTAAAASSVSSSLSQSYPEDFLAPVVKAASSTEGRDGSIKRGASILSAHDQQEVKQEEISLDDRLAKDAGMFVRTGKDETNIASTAPRRPSRLYSTTSSITQEQEVQLRDPESTEVIPHISLYPPAGATNQSLEIEFQNDASLPQSDIFVLEMDKNEGDDDKVFWKRFYYVLIAIVVVAVIVAIVISIMTRSFPESVDGD